MPQWRDTVFTWFTERQGDGPHEEYAPGMARTLSPINVVPGTAEARVRAAGDFCGRNVVKVGQAQGKTVYYVSRDTPFAYPGLINSYCTNLVQGEGQGVGKASEEDGVDYDQYRFLLTTQPRDYFVREDDDVLATQHVGATDVGSTTHLAGNATLSPLYNPGGGPFGSYPDEGDSLRQGWAQYSRYVSRRILPAARAITLPSGYLGYVSGGALNYNFAIPEGAATVCYVQHCVPLLTRTENGPWSGVPWNHIAAGLGGVNEDTFDGFWPQTLLFESFEHETYPGPLGDMLVTLRFNFSYVPKPRLSDGKVLGHCATLKFFGAPTSRVDYDSVGSYDAVAAAGDLSKPPLRPVDYPAFFRPDQPP
jgi:hypothetical protein